MTNNLAMVVPGFFLIVLVLCIIVAFAHIAVNRYERRKAMRMHPSNWKPTGLNSPERRY